MIKVRPRHNIADVSRWQSITEWLLRRLNESSIFQSRSCSTCFAVTFFLNLSWRRSFLNPVKPGFYTCHSLARLREVTCGCCWRTIQSTMRRYRRSLRRRRRRRDTCARRLRRSCKNVVRPRNARLDGSKPPDGTDSPGRAAVSPASPPRQLHDSKGGDGINNASISRCGGRRRPGTKEGGRPMDCGSFVYLLWCPKERFV